MNAKFNLIINMIIILLATMLVFAPAASADTWAGRADGSGDGAEEWGAGEASVPIYDLELGAALIGVRFGNVSVPQGAIITNAYIQFTVEVTSSEDTNLTIWGQAHDDAPIF